jgi:acetyl esterase/lipase
MRSMAMGVVLAAALVVSGCSGDADNADGAPASTTGVPSDTTSAPAGTTTAPSTSAALDIELVEDVPYFDAEPGLNTPVLDVYIPSEDGLRPIVVTFHPDSAMHTKVSTGNLARAIAEEGAVVVNPTYGGPGTSGGRSAEVFRTSLDQATCAVWFAIEHAADYGGDVSDIRLVGFSGGANQAAAVAMYPSDDDRRCSAPAADFTVSEVVVFEGDFTLGAGWDNVIREEPSFYDEMTVWSHIADYAGGPIHVIVDSKTTVSIARVEEALDLRHPDGPIRDRWEALGVIEEDRATLVQANEMFHDLLLEAGKETTLTRIEAANHSLSPTAQAAIIDVLFDDT